jgi:hypothetical protein
MSINVYMAAFVFCSNFLFLSVSGEQGRPMNPLAGKWAQVQVHTGTSELEFPTAVDTNAIWQIARDGTFSLRVHPYRSGPDISWTINIRGKCSLMNKDSLRVDLIASDFFGFEPNSRVVSLSFSNDTTMVWKSSVGRTQVFARLH